MAEKLLVQKFFSLDTETTGIDPITAELVGMSFSFAENQAFYVPVPANREEALTIVNIFKPAFENPDSLKIGQNIKYDLIMLANYGVTLKGKMFDTMIAHYVLQPELRHGMDYLAEIYLEIRNHQNRRVDWSKKGKSKETCATWLPRQFTNMLVRMPM